MKRGHVRVWADSTRRPARCISARQATGAALTRPGRPNRRKKRVQERAIVIEKTHDQVRDEGDVWEL